MSPVCVPSVRYRYSRSSPPSDPALETQKSPESVSKAMPQAARELGSDTRSTTWPPAVGVARRSACAGRGGRPAVLLPCRLPRGTRRTAARTPRDLRSPRPPRAAGRRRHVELDQVESRVGAPAVDHVESLRWRSAPDRPPDESGLGLASSRPAARWKSSRDRVLRNDRRAGGLRRVGSSEAMKDCGPGVRVTGCTCRPAAPDRPASRKTSSNRPGWGRHATVAPFKPSSVLASRTLPTTSPPDRQRRGGPRGRRRRPASSPRRTRSRSGTGPGRRAGPQRGS